MNAIEEIRAKLHNFPNTKFKAGSNYIQVFPDSESGFMVELKATKNNYTVYFNGWHERFVSEEEALNCFAFGLFTECRLKEYRRLGIPTSGQWNIKTGTSGLKTVQRECFFIRSGGG